MRQATRAAAFDEKPVSEASKLEICEAALAHCHAGTYDLFIAELLEGILLVPIDTSLDTVREPAQ